MVYDNGADDVTLRVQQTVRDATDMTYGADNASVRLQTDVWNNYQQMGLGADYTNYINQVNAALAHNPLLPEIAASWVHHNTGRFDQTGEGHLDQGEINTALGRTRDPLERTFLMSVRDNYQNIRHAGGENSNAVEPNDFRSYEGQIQAQRQQMNAAALQAQQARYLMQPMLATDDGNPNRSLFRVLDNVTGGAQDGKISRGDLDNFVKQYDRAAMNGGDLGQGIWTRANRDYAQHLSQNWDTREVKNLRTALEYDDDGRLQMETGRYITERSLLTASGYGAGANIYAKFETPKPQPKPVHREVPQQCADAPQTRQIAQQRADFERQLTQHINAEAHYTVKPGQGFDNIARDVIRTHSNDGSYRDNTRVRNVADNIARMNGRDGRLAKNPSLQAGEDLQVFDEDWIRAQIQSRMAIFDKSMKKPCNQPTDNSGY